MTNLSLYTIAQEYRALVQQLMDTQTDELAIADTLEAEAYPLEIKAQNVAYAIKNLDATAAAIKEAEQEMAARRKSIENRAKNLRQYAMACMDIANLQKITCPHFEISIRKNPSSVEIFDERMIPAEFMKQPEPPPPSPDKTAIKESIANGVDVPGAKLIQSKRLHIA